jgi:hypothetical protein
MLIGVVAPRNELFAYLTVIDPAPTIQFADALVTEMEQFVTSTPAPFSKIPCPDALFQAFSIEQL